MRRTPAASTAAPISRHRLFEQDVLAGLRRRHGGGDVMPVGCDDRDGLDLGAGQKLGVVAVSLTVEAAGDLAGAGGIDIGDADEIEDGYLRLHAGVQLAHEAQPDHTDLQTSHRPRPG
jgi:hypothetical protein